MAVYAQPNTPGAVVDFEAWSGIGWTHLMMLEHHGQPKGKLFSSKPEADGFF